MRKARVISSTSPHKVSNQKKEKPKAWMLKKIRLQKKLKTSWEAYRTSPRVRSDEGADIQILALPYPIKAYRMLHTMGNRSGDGERGGCAIIFVNVFIPSRVNQADRAPVVSAMKIDNRIIFVCFFIAHHQT